MLRVKIISDNVLSISILWNKIKDSPRLVLAYEGTSIKPIK
jgi:hypothetical protein